MPNTGGRVQRTGGHHIGMRREGNIVVVELEQTNSHLIGKRVGYTTAGRKAWKADTDRALRFIAKYNVEGFDGITGVEVAPVNPGKMVYSMDESDYVKVWV